MKMDINEQKKYPIYNINNKLISVDFINSTLNEYIENYDLKGLKCNRSDLKIKNIDLWQRALHTNPIQNMLKLKEKVLQ